MRRALLLVVLALAVTSCSDRLGRTVPECNAIVSTGIIIQIQAVPSASLVPCIDSLPTGWEYNHLEPRRGRAEFSIDSDRMGAPFMHIRTSAECLVPDAAIKTTSMDADVELHKAVAVDTTVPIVFIAEGPTDETIDAVQEILTELIGRTFNGRRPEVTFDRTEGPTSDRIRRAQASGAHVAVVGLREAEEGTVALLLAGTTEEKVETVESALHIFDEIVPEPSYRGSWFYVFEGGCTEYVFDAEGPDTVTISRHADASLSFMATEPIKETARAEGFDLP